MKELTPEFVIKNCEALKARPAGNCCDLYPNEKTKCEVMNGGACHINWVKGTATDLMKEVLTLLEKSNS